ncbi:outer membrane beta-barrel protein, partial [bacterium]|nr:outer membrane beta-barrel protein [bacterium]
MSDSRTQCIILAACLFLFPIVLMAQVGDSTKLLTPGVGCELGFGSNGHADVQLAIRINTPSFEHLVWGFSLQGGLMLHNTSDYYYSDNPNSSYDDVKDWYSFAFSLQAGYEFKPSGDVNPFVMVGYGFWEYSFIAANDSSEVNVGGKTGSFVPVLIGCDFKVLK